MKGRNPLMPLSVCIPDAEAHVMPDGQVYLYGSLDIHEDGYCSDRYITISSGDLVEWKADETPSFLAAQVPWAKAGTSKKHSSLGNVRSIEELPAHIQKVLPPEAKNYPIEQIIAAIEQSAEKGLPGEIRLYAPDAICRNGEYYLYFCLSDNSEGAAKSDCPGGPFGEAVRLPVDGIDPAVFVDDDGCAYYYWGQFEANAACLTPDMMHIEEGSIRKGLLTEKEHHFHEGSSMRKRGDTYYYVFADISRGKPTCLGYATSSSPLGPFTYQGVIIDNNECDPESWNNHGSIEEVNGQWYVFYHRSSNHSQYLRRVCCEPIFFDENGLIPEVKMTSRGAGEPLRAGEALEAGLACAFSGDACLDTINYPEGAAVIPPGGRATFRYLENDAAVTTAIIICEKECPVVLFADGTEIAGGKSGRPMKIVLGPGKHEISIGAEGETAVLLSFSLW